MQANWNRASLYAAAALMAVCGSVWAQSSRGTGAMVRSGSFRNSYSAPAASPIAPISVVRTAPAPSAAMTAAAVSRQAAMTSQVVANRQTVQPTRQGAFQRPASPPVVVPSSGGRAALPAKQNIMPRSTGAGLAPTQVVVPETTYLPATRYPVNDSPRPPAHVDPRTYGAPGQGAFDGPVQGDYNRPLSNEPRRQGSFRGFTSPELAPGGLSVNGVYQSSDGRFSLAMHLGSASWCNTAWNCGWYAPCRPIDCGWNSCVPCYPSYGWGGYWPYYYDNYPTYSYTLPVVNSSSVMYQDPALAAGYAPGQSAAPAASNVPTDFDRGAQFMAARQFGPAATAFRAAVKTDPGDAPARRWLGIALLLNGRTQDGAAEVSRAYATDPTMADAAPDLESVGLTVRQMTDLCAPVITYARRVNSSAGYVTAAMLMQSRSRPDLAAKMLNSAREAGLDASVMVQLTQGMTK